MRNLFAIVCVICATIVACSSAPMWSAPGWILAAIAVVARR